MATGYGLKGKELDTDENEDRSVKISPIIHSEINRFIEFMKENRGLLVDCESHLSIFPLHSSKLIFLATKNENIFGMVILESN